MNVLLETSPLRNANSIRGVGVYTRFLSQELEKLENSTDQYFTQEDIGLEQLNAFMAKHGIDIIHYPYFDLFRQTLPLSFTKKILGRTQQKIVVTIHDVIPLLYPQHYPAGIRGKAGFILQKQALKDVAAVVTDSETSRKDIHQYLGVPLAKITSVPLAGNPNVRKVSAIELLQTKKNLQIPDKYVLYVGDINYNKNIPQLLESMKMLDDSVHLICVGVNFRKQPIPEWRVIEQELSGISQRIHFITTIAKEDTKSLSALYSGAIAYIQPSLYEGFGLPLLEAMQCETLVISSNTPALLEIGGKGTIFVSPTAKEMAKAIKQALLLSPSQRHERIKDNNLRLRDFSWEKAAKQTVAVYKSLL